MTNWPLQRQMERIYLTIPSDRWYHKNSIRERGIRFQTGYLRKRRMWTDDKLDFIFKRFFIVPVGLRVDRCVGDRGMYHRREMEKE